MSGGARDRSQASTPATDRNKAEPTADHDAAAASRHSQRAASADFRSHLEPHAPQLDADPRAALRSGSVGAMAAAFIAAGDFAGEEFLMQVRDRFGPRIAERVRDVASGGAFTIVAAGTEHATPLSFGEAMRTKAPPPAGPVEPQTIGQSRAPNAPGQSRPLDPTGQSIASAHDRDSDGHEDLLLAPGDLPAAQPQLATDARRLATAAEQAIARCDEIATTILPTFVGALDALDAAAVGDAATDIIGAYTDAAQVGVKLRVQLEADEATADRETLGPLRVSLDAALARTSARLASELGVQRFHGRPVMPGVAPVHLAASPLVAAERLKHEAGAAQGLIVTIHEIAALVPVGDAAAAKTNGPAAAAKVRIWSGRPVHFAFMKAALSERGVWSQIEHANIPGEIRTLGQLGQDVGRDAARFGAMADIGGYDADTAGVLLAADKPSREDALAVLDSINSAAADARGAILEDLHRRGLLEKFAERLSYDEAEKLHDSARDGAAARSVLRRRYGENPRTGDTTISTGSGTWLVSPLVALTRDKVPFVGRAYRFALNVGTFGFTEEHDAAHRLMQSGEISEDEYVDASNHALARSVAVGAVSTATGGAAGSYVEGLTASIAARGAAGRIASTTATGIAGGAAGGAGARLGSDLVDGEMSGADEYATDAAIGGAVGGGLGFGASSLTAAAKYVPEHLKTPVHRLLARLPSIADDSEVFAAIRSLGERHSQGLATFTATTSHLAELAAHRVATIAPEVWAAIDRAGAKLSQFGDGMGPQLATPNGAPASSSTAPRFRFTAKAARPLHAPGDDAGALLHVQKAERLGDDAASYVDDPLTHHLGDGPEARAMQVVDSANDAARQRSANAAATRSNVGSRTELAEHIPPPGPEFVDWWDSLTLKELRKFLDDESVAGAVGAERIIANSIRHPGGLHEWLMVKHQLQIKRWGVSLQTVLDARTRTEATVGRHFKHGSTGSGQMHNRLDELIETSPSFDAFKRRLNEWADRELFPVRGPSGEPPAGRYYLPPELQTK